MIVNLSNKEIHLIIKALRLYTSKSDDNEIAIDMADNIMEELKDKLDKKKGLKHIIIKNLGL